MEGAPLKTRQSRSTTRPVAAIAGQSSDHAGEGGEGIGASTLFEQCDTFRAITAGRSARSARLLVGSILGSSRKRSRCCPGRRASRVRSVACSCPHPPSDGRGDDLSDALTADDEAADSYEEEEEGVIDEEELQAAWSENE